MFVTLIHRSFSNLIRSGCAIIIMVPIYSSVNFSSLALILLIRFRINAASLAIYGQDECCAVIRKTTCAFNAQTVIDYLNPLPGDGN